MARALAAAIVSLLAVSERAARARRLRSAVVQPVLRAAIRTRVRGFVPGGSQFNYTQNSEDWWLMEQR